MYLILGKSYRASIMLEHSTLLFFYCAVLPVEVLTAEVSNVSIQRQYQ